MKISNRQMLVFSLDYPPNTGGISRLMAEVTRQLINSGVSVRVLTKRDKHDRNYHYFNNIEERVVYPRPLRELHALFKVMKVPKDSIIICGTFVDGYIAKLAGRNNIILFAYGGEIISGYQWWKIHRHKVFLSRLFNSVTAVIGISRYTSGLVKGIAESSNLITIPLGVDADFFKPGDKEKSRDKLSLPRNKSIVLTVSRLVEYKGFEVIFKAMAALPEKERQKIIHVIAGTGPDQERLQAMTRELGIESQVKWLGFVADEDLPDLYRAADLFVLCTREYLKGRGVEGFGLVFLEAQASGVPVVGTRTGGIPDAIQEGEGGFFIAEDDSDALKDFLELLCRNPAYFQNQGALARERVVRECTWEHYIARFIEALQNTNGSD